MRPLGAGREVAPGVSVIALLARSHHLDVYDAWCAPRACRVVVKTPRPDKLREPAARTDLLREGRLLRRLAHPHIVRAYGVHDGPRPVIVLETLGGETLAHLLYRRRRRRLAATEIAHLGVHIASALAYLHAEGVLHLDVKPSNIVAEGGRAKLIDLSIARPPGRMRAGRGTWGHMSPEQARGGVIAPAADVWGLGTVLYEAATGAGPFDAYDEEEDPQLAHRAARLRSVRRAPAPLAALIDGCLEPVPGDRPRLDEALAALGEVAAPC